MGEPVPDVMDVVSFPSLPLGPAPSGQPRFGLLERPLARCDSASFQSPSGASRSTAQPSWSAEYERMSGKLATPVVPAAQPDLCATAAATVAAIYNSPTTDPRANAPAAAPTTRAAGQQVSLERSFASRRNLLTCLLMFAARR